MLTMREVVVATISMVLSLAVALGVLAVRANERRSEIDALEARLLARIDGMQGKNDELARALDSCRIASGQPAQPQGAKP